MTKKLYVLISTVIGACAAVASAIVAYCQPAMTPAIVAAIGIGAKAVDDILVLFVKDNAE